MGRESAYAKMKPWLWEGSRLSLVEETNWEENEIGHGVASATKWIDESGVKHGPRIDLDVSDILLVNDHFGWAGLLDIDNNEMHAEFRVGELNACYVCSEHPEALKIEWEGETGHGTRWLE